MEDVQDNRLVRKYFKCSKCKLFDAHLVNPLLTNIRCGTCSSFLKEISEEEYKKLKQLYKERRKGNQNRHNNNPNRPPSNAHQNERENRNRNRDRGNNNRENQERRQRGQSSLHSSRIIFNNINERNNNNYNNNCNNINNHNNNNYNNHHYNNNYNNINNHNNINININRNNNNINRNNRNNNRQQRRDNHQHNRRRDHSSERSNNVLQNLLGNIFRPLSNMANPLIFGNVNRNPFRIVVQRQNVSHDIFDPIFSTFGSMFNGAFQDNYSSNFSSNYRGNFINEILRILEQNQAENRREAHPPTSNENLNKLKKFNMTEKYCKKEKDGKYELPNCCICLDEIALGEKTILLPCGHMFHSDCIVTWLKKNNTCPMCRFEIK